MRARASVRGFPDGTSYRAASQRRPPAMNSASPIFPRKDSSSSPGSTRHARELWTRSFEDPRARTRLAEILFMTIGTVASRLRVKGPSEPVVFRQLGVRTRPLVRLSRSPQGFGISLADMSHRPSRWHIDQTG